MKKKIFCFIAFTFSNRISVFHSFSLSPLIQPRINSAAFSSKFHRKSQWLAVRGCSRMPKKIQVYPEGQDPSELFETYEAPISLGILSADELPRSLGQTKFRHLVHRNGDWHRAAHVWLFNTDGELLLQRRSKHKDTYPNMWDVSVGGHVSAGDGTYETAIKEVKEELGIDVETSKLHFLFRIATSNSGSTEKHGSFQCNEYKDIYLFEFDGKAEDIMFSPGEVAEVKWVHWSKVEENLRSCNLAYIPRSTDYINGLFSAIKQSFLK